MKIKNAVAISDTHFGCRLGLCPAEGLDLDDGGHYEPSDNQKKVWGYWLNFCNVWLPRTLHKEKFVLIHNGDVVEGRHHSVTTQISQNLADQLRLAKLVLSPLVEKASAYYQVRGTEAHVGQSAELEEILAQELEAIPTKEGRHSRWELWLRVGRGLVHFLHHIGTTGSVAYETTAVNKEIVEEYTEAGKTRQIPPDIVVRSHRHRFSLVDVGEEMGSGISVTTPGWQLQTPLTWRSPRGRVSPPQFGGIVIRQGDEELHVRRKIYSIVRSEIEG